MKTLNIALSKGRLSDLSIDFFEKAGIDTTELKDPGRKLILEDQINDIRFFLVKPGDVPTYVEYGAADMGIVGKDTLLEEGRNLYEVLDLGFGKCKMAVAGPPELKDKLDRFDRLRIGTKYPEAAKKYFEGVKGRQIEVIKLNGSVELAPLVGLSEVIVDIVESGKTLKENGLVILEEIADISARLIVNRVSMKIKNEKISKLIADIKRQL
ncbi:MAG TPA: ATP phosphoribosyltransferase [Clostridiales bacterium]|nr:ATP phosphoribosyltransferase [Clostridiales bacterium]